MTIQQKPLILFLLIFFLVGMCLTLPAQIFGSEGNVPKPGVRQVQVRFSSLKPSASFKIGKTADWVLVTDRAVWVAGSRPYSVRRIDPATNTVVAKVTIPGEACSGLAAGFGSIWVPVCGKKPVLVRVDEDTNTISARLAIGPAGPEGGITSSDDSVWMVTDKKGTLTRIDPRTNTVRQQIAIPPGSYNPLFSDGVVWITGVESNILTAVDASSGEVLVSVPVGPKPRFLAAGGGAVWTLNQGDGTVTRVDASSRKVTAAIRVGIPGTGGDICYGAGSVWTSVFGVPLTRIDARTNNVLRQWIGPGGDSVRFGFESIWLTDYRRGLLLRIPFEEGLEN
jgi:virginiamycin B lyase